MWWLIIFGGLAAAWHFTSITSESVFQNTVCPIFVFIFLISSLLKVVIALGPENGKGGHGGGFFDGFSGGDGGGDGGC